MSIKTVHGCRDAWVNEAKPKAIRSRVRLVRIMDGTGVRQWAFLRPPLRGILGRNVISATLTGIAAAAAPAQNLTVRRISEPVGGYNRLNWNRRPNTVGPSLVTAVGSLVDGDEVALDVTEHIQAVAAGAPWYGLRLSTDSTTNTKFYSEQSSSVAWTLTIQLSEELEQPDGMTPDGGSVSSGAPILSWPAPDLGGETDQKSFQVQIDAAMDEAAPDFDSGTVVSVDPMYNLATDGAAAGYVAIAAAATTYWRVRVLSEGDVWSDWSDWAEFTHTPKPVLTITQPTGGAIYDPTPPFEGSVASGGLEAIRLYVLAANDSSRIRWDSGPIAASGLTFAELVDEFYNGRRVLRDDSSYRFRVHAWESGVTRAAGVVGDPTYLEAETVVTFDDDLAVEAPAAYDITSDGSPKLTHSFTRSVDPDAFVIRRDGKVYARLTSDDWTKIGTTYSWTDGGQSPAYVEATYTVDAVVANRASTRTAKVFTPEPKGVWLIRSNGDVVMLRGDGVDNFRILDAVATYETIDGRTVDVHYGSKGVAGSYEGALYDMPEQSLAVGLAVLQAIKDAPSEPVQMVWAMNSHQVCLRHLSPLSAGDFLPTTKKHNVSFEFYEDLEVR